MQSAKRYRLAARACTALATLVLAGYAEADFTNFETPQVHPIDLAPGGNLLAAVNTADNRVEIFSVDHGILKAKDAIRVGYDPVSVRFRTANEAWVVNQISDSVSIVDIARGGVVHTVQTMDEPADVVFAGNPERAYISCSQTNAVQVVDPAHPERTPTTLPIEGEDPRSMTVSPDGKFVYVGIFESGN